MSDEHRHLQNGIELAVLPLAGRSVAAMEIRLFAGYAFEEPAHLGVAHVLQEAITKGTAKRDGRALNDAFDEIGARHATAAGRETVGFSCLCLPEFITRAIELHAELIRTPTFPDGACEVAVDLARQALAALDDEPQELARKLLHRQAYGDPLGRHELGEAETLARIGRQQIVEHWKRHFSARRMQVAVAGAVEPSALAALLEKEFDGFGVDGAEAEARGRGADDDDQEPGAAQPAGSAAPEPAAGERRSPGPERPSLPLRFLPGQTHYAKDVRHEQIAICFPGSAATDADLPVERVLIGLLAGGMSSRLWSAVREKEGLVYGVGAWSDRPRTGGMVHLGAATVARQPEVERTYATLLCETDRLAQDVTEAEIERAITGLVARACTHEDVTQARAVQAVNDLFYYGRPIPIEEKLAKVKAVKAGDVRRYLEAHPRDRLSVVTLGPINLNVECQTPGTNR